MATKLTPSELAAVLRDAADAVEASDSMEGWFKYEPAALAPGAAPTFDASYAFRVGNRGGQGGWRMSEAI